MAAGAARSTTKTVRGAGAQLPPIAFHCRSPTARPAGCSSFPGVDLPSDALTDPLARTIWLTLSRFSFVPSYVACIVSVERLLWPPLVTRFGNHQCAQS